MKEKRKVAIVVGRFQVPWLTDSHGWLIQKAFSMYDDVYILIGDTKILPNGYKRMDSHDPYPFEVRKYMILEYINDRLCLDSGRLLGIDRFEDVGDVGLWNKALDDFLEDKFKNSEIDFEFVMFGSRDSFVINYSGKNEICLVDSPEVFSNDSGTSLRKHCYESDSRTIEYSSLEFRRGVLWAVMEMERLKNLNNDGEKA